MSATAWSSKPAASRSASCRSPAWWRAASSAFVEDRRRPLGRRTLRSHPLRLPGRRLRAAFDAGPRRSRTDRDCRRDRAGRSPREGACPPVSGRLRPGRTGRSPCRSTGQPLDSLHERSFSPLRARSGRAPQAPVQAGAVPRHRSQYHHAIALCLGLTAIRLAFEGRFEPAVIAIVAAAVLDGVDGRIARLLKGTSRFGAELDSASPISSISA